LSHAGRGRRPSEARQRNDVLSPRVDVAPDARRRPMLKGGLLWLIGIPLPIILIIWFFGYLS
jgi:hypothetical protein